MGQKTNIGWCDSTVNPTTGCDGCELWKLSPTTGRHGGPCYAGNLHETRLTKSLPRLYAADFTEVRTAPGRCQQATGWADLAGLARPDKPWLDGMPRLVFVGDMGDVLSAAVPFEYLESEVVAAATSTRGRRHLWLVLTKRPARLAEFARWLASRGTPWPANVWAGTSITGPASLRRLDELDRVPAPVAFASVEPLSAGVSLAPWLAGRGASPGRWVSVGGESSQPGHHARPFALEWARTLRDEAAEAGVPYYLKQLGDAPRFNEADIWSGVTDIRQGKAGEDWTRWPEDIRIRQVPRIGADAKPLAEAA